MRATGVRPLLVMGAIALAACSGGGFRSADGGSTPPPGRVADVETAVLSGIEFGYPAGWTACKFPGNVVFGDLVEIRPEGSRASAGPPLSVQVNEGVGSYERMIEIDRIPFETGNGEYSEEEVDVPGATEATLLRFNGRQFGFDYAGIALYAVAENDDVVKVTLYTTPDAVDDLEPVFQTTVDSLDLEGGGSDTDVPACAAPGMAAPQR